MSTVTSVDDVIENVSRRDVLRAGAALTLSVAVAGPVFADAADVATLPDPIAGSTAGATRTASGQPFAPNDFVRISSDDVVTIVSKHLEMGQGIYTGLATLVAEELDARWDQLRVEGAPADAARYSNLMLRIQGTGGSTSLANSFDQFRKAGAVARAMLVSAAAQRWKVPTSEIRIADGLVSHASSTRTARFGELVAQAAKLPVPKEVALKDAKDFRYIGKPAHRLDTYAKAHGTAIYTQDVELPGMLTAVVAHPERFGAKLKSFDATRARAVKGVQNVVAFETPARVGVAVIARDYWTARKGRDALTIEWDESAALKTSSAEMFADYRALATKPGARAHWAGDPEAALTRAARTFEATYEFPYLAHAAMEPMNVVVRLGEKECEVWNGEQLQTANQMALAKFLGIRVEDVRMHMLYAGGSFGRRGNFSSDYHLEAAAIAKAANLSVPLKLVWAREDDMRAGFYRPMYVHAIKAGIDANNRIIAWHHRIVGQSLVAGTMLAMMARNGIDPTSTEGVSNLPYDVPNLGVELHTTKSPVPVGFWRSVGSSHSAFAVECFIDEIARGTKADPVALRRSLLAKQPRHLAVLDAVVAQSGWGRPRTDGRHLGIAVHESFGTVVAQVAQVARTSSGTKLEKVYCAVDCGLAVNPNLIAMQ
ncbi:MAG TPA: molybdopterin cofactor-binding domain-containing protein, partial [Gemmatimonadaceae bacterium]|nr:molybdopterin cofactor-binding domain-containing protein [Gemmatimonadaceae bacterium]